jgi:hypothetical protein
MRKFFLSTLGCSLNFLSTKSPAIEKNRMYKAFHARYKNKRPHAIFTMIIAYILSSVFIAPTDQKVK